MRRFTKGLACLAAGFALVFTACGEGTPTGTNAGDALTEAEVQAVFNQLSAVFSEANLFSVSQPAPAAAPGMAAAVDVSQDFNLSVACQSGSVSLDGSLDGSIDEQSGAGNAHAEFRLDITDCVVTTETASFTVHGDPYVLFTGDFGYSQEQISLSATQQGGFKFEADDGRMGSCAIDLTFSADFSQGTGGSLSSSVSGTVCRYAATNFTPFLM